MHKQVDEPEHEVARGVRVERALSLWSYRLGLTGRADVVEFHGATPYPVEYKHGPRRQREHDDLQLCAQALCLEEMTGVNGAERCPIFGTIRSPIFCALRDSHPGGYPVAALPSSSFTGAFSTPALRLVLSR